MSAFQFQSSKMDNMKIYLKKNLKKFYSNAIFMYHDWFEKIFFSFDVLKNIISINKTIYLSATHKINFKTIELQNY